MPQSLIDSPLIIFSANICLSRINFSPKTVRRGTAATRERKRSTTLHADRQERTETEVNNFSVVVETRWKATSIAATFRGWREMFFVCTWRGWTRKILIKKFQYLWWKNKFPRLFRGLFNIRIEEKIKAALARVSAQDLLKIAGEKISRIARAINRFFESCFMSFNIPRKKSRKQ